jgi:hypothetical protein
MSKKPEEKPDAKRKPNTMVLDTEKGFALEYVETPPGRHWHYGRSLIHLAQRVNEGGAEKLIPVELPLEMGEPPEKLYRALFWAREAAILFALLSPLLEKLKLIGMYILIGILLILIFLMFNSM